MQNIKTEIIEEIKNAELVTNQERLHHFKFLNADNLNMVIYQNRENLTEDEIEKFEYCVELLRKREKAIDTLDEVAGTLGSFCGMFQGHENILEGDAKLEEFEYVH